MYVNRSGRLFTSKWVTVESRKVSRKLKICFYGRFVKKKVLLFIKKKLQYSATKQLQLHTLKNTLFAVFVRQCKPNSGKNSNSFFPAKMYCWNLFERFWPIDFNGEMYWNSALFFAVRLTLILIKSRQIMTNEPAVWMSIDCEINRASRCHFRKLRHNGAGWITYPPLLSPEGNP